MFLIFFILGLLSLVSVVLIVQTGYYMVLEQSSVVFSIFYCIVYLWILIIIAVFGELCFSRALTLKRRGHSFEIKKLELDSDKKIDEK